MIQLLLKVDKGEKPLMKRNSLWKNNASDAYLTVKEAIVNKKWRICN
jgi:hypothetical protein